MDDDLKKRRIQPQVDHLAVHASEVAEIMSCMKDGLTEETDPDRWAVSRGMKPEGTRWTSVLSLAIQEVVRDGLPMSDVPEYVRRLVDMVTLIKETIDKENS